jgi:hypothetical protein
LKNTVDTLDHVITATIISPDTIYIQANEAIGELPVSGYEYPILAICIIVAVCVLITIGLVLKLKSDIANKAKASKNSNEGDPWKNVFTDINESDKAKSLYKSLQRKLHPDKFEPNKEFVLLADKYFQRLKQNQYRYSQLVEIQEEAIKAGLI